MVSSHPMLSWRLGAEGSAMGLKPMPLAMVIVLMAAAIACIRSGETGEESPQATQHPADTGEGSSEATQPPGDAGTVDAATSEPATRPEARIEGSPLATWDPSGAESFPPSGTEPGTLEVSDGCVLLVLANGTRILPVWPEPTRWNASSQTIEYVSPIFSDERAQLQAGDRISLGGSGTSGSFSLYVRQPTAECEAQADLTFVVSQIRVESR
jgi:hypothetical protein